MIKPCCSNFRVITANFLEVQMFRMLTVGFHWCSKKLKNSDRPKIAVLILKFEQCNLLE